VNHLRRVIRAGTASAGLLVTAAELPEPAPIVSEERIAVVRWRGHGDDEALADAVARALAA
jgi:hypothetical protein